MKTNRIEVYKDMGNYILCRTVEARGDQIFVKMKKVTRRESLSF
jgi:hypothetical protein